MMDKTSLDEIMPEGSTPAQITPEEPGFDLERQKQAKVYARIRRRMMLVDLLLGAAYLLAWLIFGWSLALKYALLAYTSNEWLLLAVFAAIFVGILFLIDLPVSFYGGFILPHRFGLSNQTLGGWISDQVKSILIGGFLGLLILEVIYAVLRASPEVWWLWTAGFLLLFNVVLANLAPVLLLPLFYKFEPLEDEHADLEARLLRLAGQARTRVVGVYKFDMSRRTKAANAGLAGLGNTRRIILGDTLLDEFTPDEIETVLAHELAHQVHKDIPMGILVESVITLAGLYLAALGLRWGVEALGFEGPADIAGLPLLAVVLGTFGLVTMPLVNAYSRWREHRADEYALRATAKGPAFASAMVRLADQNLTEANPEPWVVFLFYSHPPLRERIAMARENK